MLMRLKDRSFAVSTMILALFLVMACVPAEAYHFWYKDSDGANLKTEPYKWTRAIPKIEVSVNHADEAVRTAVFNDVKEKIEVWNAVDGAQKTLGEISLVASADAFTAANFKTTWGRTDDNKVEVVFDYDFSVFEGLGFASADKNSVNGYGPSYRKVDGGKPVIYDGYILMNRTRDNFDWQSTVVHEFGHLLGLAHSSVGQFNSNFSNFKSFGYNAPTDALDVIPIGSVPTMHPFSNGTGEGRRTPKTDDKAGIMELYPAAAGAAALADYGGISGRILRLVGSTETAVKGANVRAVKVDDTTVQATRYSSYDNNADGRFYIGGLPAGQYKLLVEVLGYNDFGPYKRMAVVSDWEYNFPQEYYSGAAESFTEALPDAHDPVTASGGTTVINKDIKVGKVDFAFVVDDTGSMGEEIGGVKTTLRNLINEYATKYAEKKIPFPTIAIVTFKDNVTIRKVSNDKDELLVTVDALSATGGADCPEASNAALLAAGPMLSEGSTAILFTDADSRPNGPTMAQVLAFFNSKKITLSTLLSGVCTEEAAVGGALVASAGGGNRDESDDPAELGFQSAFRTFSTMSDVTTGVFAFRNKYTAGFDREWYDKAATDISRSVFDATVALVEPSTLYKGTTMDVTITGAKTNFTGTSLVDFSGGITVNSFNAISSTKIEANVTVPDDAPVSGDVTVTTGAEQATGGFFKVAGVPEVPAIISVSPNTGEQGTTVNVTITGAKTEFKDDSTVDIGGGIAVSKVKAASDTLLTAELTIAPDAGVTSRAITVSDDVTSLPGGASFRVTAPVPDLPEINTISPAKWAPGSSGKLTITGRNTHFTDGTTVVTFDPPRVTEAARLSGARPFADGDPIVVTKTTVINATEMEVEISVAATAPNGYYTVIATTGDERATKRDALEVSGESPFTPSIASVRPAAWKPGSSGKLSIVGENTAFVQGTTVVTFSKSSASAAFIAAAAPITVTGATVKNATEVDVDIAVAADAPLGLYTVTVTTGAQVVARPNAITVADPFTGGGGCNLNMNAPFAILLVLPILLLKKH